jgi:hypothetical protein
MTCSNPGIVANTWFHIGFTYKASTTTARVFFNGSCVMETTSAPTLLSAVEYDLGVGNRTDLANYSAGYSNGFRLYHKELAPNEVGTLHSNEKTIYEY